jgi:hypothetical protein
VSQPVASVEEFLAALDHDRRAQVNALRAILLEVEPRLVERIKWNAPSFALDGVDRVTVNTSKADRVRLVLHMGVARAENRTAPPVMADPSGLVAWSSDIRGVLTFSGLTDVTATRPAIADVLARWLAIPV